MESTSSTCVSATLCPLCIMTYCTVVKLYMYSVSFCCCNMLLFWTLLCCKLYTLTWKNGSAECVEFKSKSCTVYTCTNVTGSVKGSFMAFPNDK